MNPDLEKLLELQRFDTRAMALQKENAALPRYVAQIEAALGSHVKKVEADRAILNANQTDRKQQDLDIQTHQAKIAKLKEQMNTAKTNEQFRAFQTEIEFCEKSIRKCEDKVVELLEQSESLTAAVAAAEASLETEKKKVEAEKAGAKRRNDSNNAKLAEIAAQRKAVADTVSPGALSAYDKCRKRGDVAVAEAGLGRCSGCQIEIRPQHLQELKKLDAVIQCENCRRILVYNPAAAPEVINVPPPKASSAKGPATSANVPAGTGKRIDMS